MKTYSLLKILVTILLLFSLKNLQTNISAQEKIQKPKWFQENQVASITIQNSNKIFKRFLELGDESSPNFSKSLEKNLGGFYAILENSTNFSVLVFETPDDDLEFVFFITVTESKIFEASDIVEYKEKLIVNNTIIFDDISEENELEKYKKFVPILLGIKQTNDIETYYDLKFFFKELKEEAEGNYPNLNSFLEQFYAFSLKANLTKESFSISTEIIPKENSALQKFFTQSKIDNLNILEPLGSSNLFGCLAQIDTAKLYILISEITQAFAKKDDENKNSFLDSFKALQENSPTIIFGENISFSEKLMYTNIIKMNKCNLFFSQMTESISKNKSEFISAIKLGTEFLSFDLTEADKHKIDNYFTPIEKISDQNSEWSIYQIGKDSIKTEQPFKIASVNENYLVISDSKEKNNSICERLKKNPTKPTITLESVQHFKSGYMFYGDFFLNTIIKNIFSDLPQYKDKIKSLFPENQKQILIACKLEGTLNTKIQINAQVLKGLVGLFAIEENINLEDDEDLPMNDKNSQP